MRIIPPLITVIVLTGITGSFIKNLSPSPNRASRLKFPIYQNNFSVELSGNETDRNDGWKLAAEREFKMTRDPRLNLVPTERLFAAKSQLQSSGLNMLNPLGLSWQERGPANIGGRTRAMVIDKSDGTNNTVIAAGVTGGLWRTTNFKSSNIVWSPVNDLMNNLNLAAMAQDPRPGFQNIFYAGTGEAFFSTQSNRGTGIFKSTDYGLNWTLLSATTSNYNMEFVQKLVVDNNGNIYAACASHYCNGGGLWKSTDGGTSWNRVIGTSGLSCGTSFDLFVDDIEIAPNNDIYVSTGYYFSTPGKIFKSSYASYGSSTGNAGTWMDITPSGNYNRIELAVAPSNVNRVYALCEGRTSQDVVAVERTDNGGNSWTSLPVPSVSSLGSTVVFTNQQASYDLAIAVDPNKDNTVLIGGLDLLRSTDAGLNWTQISIWVASDPALTPSQYVHADHHIILYEPGSSGNALFGNDGGIFYSSNLNIAGIPDFSSKNNGYRVTQFYSGDLHPTPINYSIGGTQDNGSIRLKAAGIDSGETVSTGDGGFCHIDKTNPNIQITSYVYNSYHFSIDGGATFTGLHKFSNDYGEFINPTEYDDSFHIMYVCDSVGRYGIVYNIGNLPQNWPDYYYVDFGNVFGERKVTAIKVDPNNHNTVWFCLSDDINFSLPPVVVRVDSAAFNNPYGTQFPLPAAAVPGSYISSIDLEPGNSSHIIVTLSNYGVASVFETTDGGNSWTNIEGNLPDMPVRWVKILPGNVLLNGKNSLAGVVLGTELGIFSTTTLNGSSTNWIADNGGLANVRVDMLKFRPSDRTLLAATFGRGIFTSTLASATPLTLLRFEGRAGVSFNDLYWVTAGERQVKGYELERKYPSQNAFLKIAFVASSNSLTNTRQYRYIDRDLDLSQDIALYRLRMMDLDGKFQFSPVISVHQKTGLNFVEYISASGTRLYIRVGDNNSIQFMQLRVFDMSGKLLINKTLNCTSQWVDLSVLPAGVFVISIDGSGGEHYSGKWIK